MLIFYLIILVTLCVDGGFFSQLGPRGLYNVTLADVVILILIIYGLLLLLVFGNSTVMRYFYPELSRQISRNFFEKSKRAERAVVVVLLLAYGGWNSYRNTYQLPSLAEGTVNQAIKTKDWSQLQHVTNNQARLMRQFKRGRLFEEYDISLNDPYHYLGKLAGTVSDTEVVLGAQKIDPLGIVVHFKVTAIAAAN